MGEIAQQLGRALRAGAADVGAVLVPDHRRAAHRAGLRHAVGHSPLRPLFRHHPDDLRDDLPRLLHDDRIPDADVLFRDIVLVVQGGVGHGGARQPHRRHHRLGGEHPGAPHLDHDVLHHTLLLLRRVFIGRRPAGELCRLPQGRALCEIIQLHHRPVDVEGVVLPSVPNGDDVFLHPGDVRLQGVVNHLEAQAFQPIQTGAVGVKGGAVPVLDVEQHDVQPPGGGNFGVQLAQGAGGGIAGIGEQGLSLQLPLLVEPGKGLLGHIYLPPDNELAGGPFDLHGDGADGAQVFRHVLPHGAVPPGGAPDKHAVPVLQGHGQPVHLGFHQVFHPLRALPHPAVKLLQLFRGEHILQGLKGHLVDHLLKGVQGLAPHPLGGGVRRDQLRVSRLQLLQLPEHPVVLKIGDGGVIQYIVVVVVLVQLLAQPLRQRFLVHIDLPGKRNRPPISHADPAGAPALSGGTGCE